MSTIDESSNVSDSTTSCSSASPGVSDQATGSCTLTSVSDQATSSLTPPGVSEQAANFSKQTSKISYVQHVESHEMREYLQMVSANNDADYLHVIDNDADYLRVIDNDVEYLRVIDDDADYLRVIDNDAHYLHAIADNFATVNDETGYNRLDNAQSHSEPGCQQHCYHPLIKDFYAYQETDDVQPNYEQIVDLDHNHDYSSYNEHDQAQATSTSEASFNTTADMHELQQVAVYGTSHNDDRTGTNNRTKRWQSILLVLSAAVGTMMLVCSAVIASIFVVNPTLQSAHVDEADSPPQKLANATEAFGLLRTQQHLPIFNRLLEFDSVIRNVISTSVDLSSSSFTAPQTASPSLYWMIIAVEVLSQTPARIQLANTSLIISKSHTKNSHKDIITKSGLVRLEPASVVTVQSDYAVNTAYWSGFCLNNIMQSLVAVFVASTKQLTTTDTNGMTKIPYDTVIINEGKAWDTKNDVFVVHQSGIYVFSISIGFTSLPNPVPLLGVSTLTDRQELMIGQADMGRMISSNVDFVSTSSVLQLVKGATVEGTFFRAKSTYSDTATLATSLSAFLYSPAHNNKVVWSVAMTRGSITVPTIEKPLSFDIVRLNIGGAWLPSQNTVVISTPGIYYVFVAIDVCNNSTATMWLQVNKTRILEIKFTTSPNLVQTRSNGAVIRLATGDELTVEVADVSISCFYGNNDSMNSFMGLLLTPGSD